MNRFYLSRYTCEGQPAGSGLQRGGDAASQAPLPELSPNSNTSSESLADDSCGDEDTDRPRKQQRLQESVASAHVRLSWPSSTRKLMSCLFMHAMCNFLSGSASHFVSAVPVCLYEWFLGRNSKRDVSILQEEGILDGERAQTWATPSTPQQRLPTLPAAPGEVLVTCLCSLRMPPVTSALTRLLCLGMSLLCHWCEASSTHPCCWLPAVDNWNFEAAIF